MGGFLAELGTKLAERWLSLLVLPGLLYLGTLAATYTLGHRHPFTIGRITRQLDAWTTSQGVTSANGLVLILIAGLLAADTYALFIGAAARLHAADLARSLGIDHTGPLSQQTGWALTCLLQGQSHLIPLTTGWPTSP